MASLTTRSLKSFKRDLFGGKLTEDESLTLPAAPEKITLDPQGSVWVAGHANLLLGDSASDGLTVALLPESRRLFKASGLDPESFVGRVVRVRGWLRWWKGARLEVSHPEQIELLPP